MQTREISRTEGLAVSVIIPTRNRPDLVVTAVRSALRQDFANFEIIVVIDGDDPRTTRALSDFTDPRLRVIDLAVTVGAAEARNVGVHEARGEWVAFLDDDDEWLPHKLSRQMVVARQSKALWPVISSRLIVRRPQGDSIGPLRAYKSQKTVSDYLFCRSSLQDGPYAMQTSTLLMRRELMLAVHFRIDLKRHQDWDWVLRAERVPGTAFSVLEEPLSIYRAPDLSPHARESVSRSQDWGFSMDWARDMRGFFSAKAYSWFLASECASRAVKSHAGFKPCAEIVRRFLLEGCPTPRSAAMLLAFIALPAAWRERARTLLAGRSLSHHTPAAPRKKIKAIFGTEL
ncbi:MAG: glycosyltransferase family 2 protein [Acidobacteriaceae bacterium]